MMDFVKAMELSVLPNPDRTVTEHDGYSISYNPMTDVGPETALIVENKSPEKFYILLGDHRNEYKACKNLAACRRYFRGHTYLKSGWSD
jgi:hypothetical protein